MSVTIYAIQKRPPDPYVHILTRKEPDASHLIFMPGKGGLKENPWLFSQEYCMCALFLVFYSYPCSSELLPTPTPQMVRSLFHVPLEQTTDHMYAITDV